VQETVFLLEIVFSLVYNLIRLIGLDDGLILLVESMFQGVLSLLEQLFELYVKLLHHSLEVLSCKSQELCVFDCLDSKLPSHGYLLLIKVFKQTLDIKLVIRCRNNIINFTELGAIFNLDVDNVRLKGQHECCKALALEINFLNKIGLIVNILVHRNEYLA